MRYARRWTEITGSSNWSRPRPSFASTPPIPTASVRRYWRGGFGVFSGLVPLALLEMIGDDVSSVVVGGSGRTIELRGPSVTHTARLVAKKFPAVDSVLANLPSKRVEVPVIGARRALTRLGSIIDQEALSCTLTRGEMVFTVTNSPLGSGSESIIVRGGDDAPFEFGVNLDYLNDAFKHHSGESVTLGYSEPTAPLFFMTTGDVRMTSVVMPIRL